MSIDDQLHTIAAHERSASQETQLDWQRVVRTADSRRRRKHWTLAGCATAGVAVTIGLGALGAQQLGAPNDPPVAADGPSVTTVNVPTYAGQLDQLPSPVPGQSQPPVLNPQAGGSGTLQVADNGCVTIAMEGRGSSFNAILPAGSSATTGGEVNTLTVPVNDGEPLTINDGERVKISGLIRFDQTAVSNPCAEPKPGSRDVFVGTIRAS